VLTDELVAYVSIPISQAIVIYLIRLLDQ